MHEQFTPTFRWTHSMTSATFRLPANMSLFGAPGSGKGYYGRVLAKAWNVPLYSASIILRQSSISTDTGNLVDCELVSTTLLNFFQQSHTSNFLMDGFPRTRQQIDYMDQEWPEEYRITHALRLEVPDIVCAQKIAGRRVCRICQHEPNSAHVETKGFLLPPMRPSVCENRCEEGTDWFKRADDVSNDMIAKRLGDYRRHEQPLVEYYQSCGALCSFSPYNGAKDFPLLQQTLEEWFAIVGMRSTTRDSTGASNCH